MHHAITYVILAATTLVSACAPPRSTPRAQTFACPTPLPPVVHSETDPIVEPADYETLLGERSYWDNVFQHGSDAQLATLSRAGDPRTGHHRDVVNRSWWREATDLQAWRRASGCPDVPNVRSVP